MVGERSKILVVDDDPRFGERAVALLRAAGFAASFHRGPLGTLQAVRDSGCDLVVLDVNMPKIDGVVLLRMIRDALGLGRVRVVLCSDMAPRVLEAIATSARAPFVVKSASPEVFVESIRSVLEKPAVPTPVTPRRIARA